MFVLLTRSDRPIIVTGVLSCSFISSIYVSPWNSLPVLSLIQSVLLRLSVLLYVLICPNF